MQPAISPDGKQIAYIGFDDEHKGYQAHRLHVMNRDGTGSKILAAKLDRDLFAPVWSKDGSGVYFKYEDHGTTRIGFASLDGKTEALATDLGGEDFGRPYSGGSFTVADDGTLAFTMTRPEYPAEVAVRSRSSTAQQRLTRLNENLLGHKALGQVEPFQFKSGHDNRSVEGWIVKPPHFDAKKKYPLILEIHGGPYANYGERFSVEIQLYAAAGYVVLYLNPRGSTGYGEEFAQLINGNYPGNDYDDLMAGVDALLARGYVDKDNLFVTGGSGGGVLTAWIVGKTKRFKAAVASKPVINWYSFALTADEVPVLRSLLVRAAPLGEARGVSQTFADLAGWQRDHADDAPDRGSRLPHTHVRVGAVLSGVETAQDRHRPGARSRRFAQHWRAAEPNDYQGGDHFEMV